MSIEGFFDDDKGIEQVRMTENWYNALRYEINFAPEYMYTQNEIQKRVNIEVENVNKKTSIQEQRRITNNRI